MNDRVKKILIEGAISTGLFAFIAGVWAGCTKFAPPSKPEPYEFKVLYQPAAAQDMKASQGIQINEGDLNILGGSGWQLVASYVEEETVFPNLGDPKFITGVESNVRPKRVVLLFQRPLTGR